MTIDAANDTDAVKAQVTEFLTGLMKRSTMHWTDFFEAVGEACLDLESNFVSSVLAGLPDCGED